MRIQDGEQSGLGIKQNIINGKEKPLMRKEDERAGEMYLWRSEGREVI